jgi:hypothetical protein
LGGLPGGRAGFDGAGFARGFEVIWGRERCTQGLPVPVQQHGVDAGIDRHDLDCARSHTCRAWMRPRISDSCRLDSLWARSRSSLSCGVGKAKNADGGRGWIRSRQRGRMRDLRRSGAALQGSAATRRGAQSPPAAGSPQSPPPAPGHALAGLQTRWPAPATACACSGGRDLRGAAVEL